MGFTALFSLVLHPIVLCVLLWVVARKNANLEFANVFFICLAISVASTFAQLKFYPDFGTMAFVPIALGSVFLLMRYCYTTLVQSIIVMGLFVAWQVNYNSSILTMFQ